MDNKCIQCGYEDIMVFSPPHLCGTCHFQARQKEKYRERMGTEAVKYDNGKPRMDLIPPEAMLALGAVLEVGARKYSGRNWELGFEWGRSDAALKRHLTAWEAGQDNDPETGLPHLWHVLANAAFLVTFAAREIGTDDRAKGCAVDLWAAPKTAEQANG